ncbi:MAG: sigma 54-interacting transcriptional regulator [Candidatus Methylomirabilales bacterium]
MGSRRRSMSPKASRSGEPLQAVLRLSQKMNAERHLPALLMLLAREAARLLDAEGASILLLDREKCELWSQVTLDGETIRFDARLGIAGGAALTGETINVADAQQDPRFYAGIDTRTKKRTRSLLAVPLRTPTGEVIGVLEALNKKGGAFTVGDEEVATALAAQAALAIETAQMVQGLRQQHEHLLEENTRFWKEVEGRFATQSLIGVSPRVQGVVRLIDQIRDSSVDVLITGESGTGKEVVAKVIHYNSPCARRPFVALNCAALPDNLVESELFGIEKGVATGVEHRIGKFEQAQGGTLFLDEIGDLGLTAQAKILRVLQERVLDRVGGRTALPVDVRIIAATNQNLEAAIKKGTFREDLCHRLKVIHIHMPPLREIPEDIPLLANYFLTKYCQEIQKDPKRLAPGALRCLESYPWPGNVRQLENEMKRLVVSVRRTVVTEEDLDDAIRTWSGEVGASPGLPVRSLHAAIAELEQRLIREALQACHQNQQQTARALGLSRQGLINKMKRYGITGSS